MERVSTARGSGWMGDAHAILLLILNSWCKRRSASISGRYLESYFQRFTLITVIAKSSCDRKCVPSLVIAKYEGVTFELRTEFSLPHQSGKLFRDLALSKRHYVSLPIQILFRSVRAPVLAARGGQLVGGPDHFAQALLLRIRTAVGSKVADKNRSVVACWPNLSCRSHLGFLVAA